MMLMYPPLHCWAINLKTQKKDKSGTKHFNIKENKINKSAENVDFSTSLALFIQTDLL